MYIIISSYKIYYYIVLSSLYYRINKTVDAIFSCRYSFHRRNNCRPRAPLLVRTRRPFDGSYILRAPSPETDRSTVRGIWYYCAVYVHHCARVPSTYYYYYYRATCIVTMGSFFFLKRLHEPNVGIRTRALVFRADAKTRRGAHIVWTRAAVKWPARRYKCGNDCCVPLRV